MKYHHYWQDNYNNGLLNLLLLLSKQTTLLLQNADADVRMCEVRLERPWDEGERAAILQAIVEFRLANVRQAETDDPDDSGEQFPAFQQLYHLVRDRVTCGGKYLQFGELCFSYMENCAPDELS